MDIRKRKLIRELQRTPRAAMTPKEKFVLLYRHTGDLYRAMTESGIDPKEAYRLRVQAVEAIRKDEKAPEEKKKNSQYRHNKIEALRQGIRAPHQSDESKLRWCLELLEILGF